MKRLKISIILVIAVTALMGTAFAAPQRVGVLTDSNVGIPSRVAVDASGSVYVSAPTNSIVRKFNSKGEFLGSLSVPRPLGIAISPSGLIYVCSAQFAGKQNKNAVSVFTPDLTKAGTLGIGEGEFGTPVDIDIDATGMVYVVDLFNHVVKIYNPQGVKTSSFGGYDGATYSLVDTNNDGIPDKYNFGINTSGKLRKPTGIAVTADEIYVADYPIIQTSNGPSDGVRISVFNKNGTFLRAFGQSGTGVGQIASPVELALDKAGLLYVSDNLQNVVHILNPLDGTPVGVGGLYDLANPGYGPAGVAISRNNLAYVAYGMNQTNNGRVDVYALDGYVTMAAAPGALSFVGRQNEGMLTPQTVMISNSGSGTLNWTASVKTTAQDKNWLILDQMSGSTGPASASALTVGVVNMSSLPVGMQTGTITIASDFGEQQAVSIALTVNPPPFLTINPGMLSFTAKKGKTALPKNVTITISDPVGAMNWTAASDSPWLAVAPASGTVTAAAPSATAAVSVNTSGLGFGTYNGIITVSAPGAIGDGSKINVALTISSTKISVTTSPATATFTVSGPATYTGSGPTWSVDNALTGDYTITYNDVAGYKKPASQTQTLVADGELTFSGKYASLKKNLIVAKGPGAKNDALVKVYKNTAAPAAFDLVALDSRYGANVAAGDMDGDGAAELVVGAGDGPNNAAVVRVFRADKTLVLEFVPLSSQNGARVAVADLDGDGQAEIIVAPAGGTDSTVAVYSYDKNAKKMVSTGITFAAYSAAYTNGVNIAVADIEGIGRPQIVTAPGFGKQNPGLVRTWKVDATNGMGNWTVTQQGNGTPLSAAFGATVAAGDVDGDGKDEIIAGTAGSGSSVTIIKADGTQSSFKAFDKYGVNVAAADLDGDGAAEIIAAQGPDPGDQTKTSGVTADDKLSKKKDGKEKEAEYSDADQERGSVRVYGAAGGVKYTVIPFEGSRDGINPAVGDLGL